MGHLPGSGEIIPFTKHTQVSAPGVGSRLTPNLTGTHAPLTRITSVPLGSPVRLDTLDAETDISPGYHTSIRRRRL